MKAQIFLSILLLSVSCNAAVLTVNKNGPADFNSIQQAINNSQNGDTILISPGTYFENINLLGKNITLTSLDPNISAVVNQTIIDGNSAGSVVTFTGTEDKNCVLAGLTITHGIGTKVGYATYGGGIYGSGTGATLIKCRIIQNQKVNNLRLRFGGGIYNFDGLISDCNVSFNASGGGGDGGGGGLGGCDGLIINCIISRNGGTHNTDTGGGLSGCNGIIKDCVIAYNNALEYGGGLFACKGLITGCSIIGNSCVLSDGGGFCYCDGTISNCLIANNHSQASGGGLYSCKASIINCRIIGNASLDRYGGGLAYCSGTIMGCIIANNKAVRYGGGLNGCNGPIINCTIVNNYVADGVGCICPGRGGGFADCKGFIKNCIVWGNTSGNLLVKIGNQIYASSEPSYSCIQDWTNNNFNNINLNPNFRDTNNSDFHILADSPCINAGDLNYIPEPNATDLDGNPRIIAGRIDMGAYEFNNEPTACILNSDKIVEAQGVFGAKVTLDGSCSTDDDSTEGTNDDINDFNWYRYTAEDSNKIFLGSGEILDCNLPIGTHQILLEIIDQTGAADSNEITITVQDTTSPKFNLLVLPKILWPANHKMVRVIPLWLARDICDPQPKVSFVKITNNDKGMTNDDILIKNDCMIYLRAEHSKFVKTRIYYLTYKAEDFSGNTTTRTDTIIVP